MATVHEYILWLCWGLLTLTSKSLKNPTHDILFPNEDAMKVLLVRITFAPGLLDVLRSATPPTIAFFKALPSNARGLWGVYLILLEKSGCRPRIYIGSGTGSQGGLLYRWRDYNDPLRVPLYVKKALDEGYRITHKGALCWTPIPSSAKRFPLRALFLILETVFSLALWAMVSRTKTYYMPKLLSWPIETLEYDGCCTHSAIHEVIAGETEGLSPEQIAVKEGQADIRRREQDKRAREKYYAKRNAEDFEYWRQRKNASIKKSDAKLRASQKYRCSPCNLNLKSQFALNRHKLRASHIQKTTGHRVYKAPAEKRRGDEVRAAKTHYCRLCNTALQSASALAKHYTTKGHIKRRDSAQSTSS